MIRLAISLGILLCSGAFSAADEAPFGIPEDEAAAIAAPSAEDSGTDDGPYDRAVPETILVDHKPKPLERFGFLAFGMDGISPFARYELLLGDRMSVGVWSKVTQILDVPDVRWTGWSAQLGGSWHPSGNLRGPWFYAGAGVYVLTGKLLAGSASTTTEELVDPAFTVLAGYRLRVAKGWRVAAALGFNYLALTPSRLSPGHSMSHTALVLDVGWPL